jgi:hypothetical protein
MNKISNIVYTNIVYTNCLAYASTNAVDLDKILALKDIISWNAELLSDIDAADSSDICDGHIDYIEVCCKSAGLI